MQVIGLCGAARSGKDTAAEGLVRIDWTRVAFADPVREGLLGVNPNVNIAPLAKWYDIFGRLYGIVPLRVAVSVYGWEKLKALPEVRGLLQRYGTEGGRDIHGHYCWIEVAKYRLRSGSLSYKDKIVFTDVRFPNEADFIHEEGGRVIRIERPGNDNHLTDTTGNHSSEHSLDASHWDEVILNDGTVYDLHRRIMAMTIIINS